jgi:XTP/dITP diphosphohydrolase
MEQKDIEIDEIQDLDVEKVARMKAEDAFRILKETLIVEDTALFIKSMNNYPGPMVKHFIHSIGYEGIIEYLRGKDRSAEAVTVFAFCDKKGKIRTFTGKVKGTITEDFRKGDYFAWDRIFIPEGYDKTYAELGMEQKNRISQRRKALKGFVEWYITRISC